MKLTSVIKKHKWVTILPALFVMGIIFRSSSQTYTQQDLRPGLAEFLPTQLIQNLFGSVSFTYAGKLISIESVGVAGFVEFFLRKAAHFSIFFLLSFALFYFFYNITKKITKSSILTFLCFSLYAMLDELHQNFTGGRTPLVQDVLIDITGGTIALIIILMMMYRRLNKKT